MKQLTLFILFLGVLVTFGAPSAFAGAAKVSVCHSPPDNPDNFHTITINENALASHLAHGDIAGSCNAACATLCDDGNACTIDDNGEDCEQLGCPVDRAQVDCSDGNTCTVDTCDPGQGCVNTPNVGAYCDDGETCTGVDTCNDQGQCTGSSIPNCCLSNDDCSTDLCDNASCNVQTYRCEDNPVSCVPTDLCHVSVCDQTDGNCSETPVTCGEGESCDVGTGLCVPVVKCTGKLQEVVVIWNGDDSVNLTPGNGVASLSASQVEPGDVLTIFTDGSTNDVFVNITGSVSGESKFHISCSDRDMNADNDDQDQQQLPGESQDCGKFQGNAKSTSGFINTWLLEGMLDADGLRLVCNFDPTASLGDFVWEDLNANGIQDPAELDDGINGAEVKLLTDTNNDGIPETVVAAQLTGNDPDTSLPGWYKFSGLLPGRAYSVMFTNPDPDGPDAYMFSPRQVGGDPAVDSDGPMSDVVILGAGEFNDTLDAGLFRKGSIHVSGFLDGDGDGNLDDNEGPFPNDPGKTFELLDENGDVIATSNSIDGMVWFTGLTPGTYTVRENPIPDGFALTTLPNARTFTVISGQELVYEDGAAMLPTGDQRFETNLGDDLRWGNSSIEPANN